MSQTSLTNIDKAAVLLTRLDPQALDKVLELLGKELGGKLRPVLAAVSRRKDFHALSDQVLQEFRELQADVRDSVSGSPNLRKPPATPDSVSPATPENAGHRSDDTRAAAEVHVKSGESVSDEATKPESADASSSSEVNSLAKLPPAVLGAGLKLESPRMIATVLKQLPSEISGKVLEVLPPDLRPGVFLMMADNVQVNPAVIRRVLRKLFEVCQSIDPAAAEQTDRRLKSLIGILQTVEREERIRLLESLTERDPELAAQIDNLMYDYTDILRIEDRSVQKLLSQLEQKVVAVALKTAADDLRQKVLKNLSERVRAALNEEMELLATVAASKADLARREIANVIRAQDKEGSLVWME